MSSRTGIALAAIIGIALVLRLVGLQYGLPAVYNPDEAAIMARALSFAKGTLNPHNFLYPTLYFYVLFAWVGAYLALVWLTGGVSSVLELQQLYFTDPVGLYTAGRILGAVLGSLSVAAIYKLAAGLYGRTVGILAALFLAFAPLAVRDSHYIKHDIPATLAVILAYLAITRIWPRVPQPGRLRNDVVIAAAACGVAFSTHYYCIFLALPLTWAVVQRWRADRWRITVRHLVTAAIVSAVVFFALSPFILVEPIVAWRDIAANRRIVVDRAVESGAFAPAARYLEILWSDSIGRSVIALALLGCAGMATKAWKEAVLLLLFPLAFCAFITNTVPASRYLNPVLPFVALFAARGLATLQTSRLPPALVWVVAAVVAAGPLFESVRSDRFFRTPDTRQLAQQFISDRIPPGASILVQPYSVVLTASREGLVEALAAHGAAAGAASTKFQLQLGLDPYPKPAYRVIYLGRGGLDVDKIYVDPTTLGRGSDLGPLRRLGVTYVVLKRYNTLDSEMNDLVAELARHGRVIAAFSPYKAGVSEAERARVEPFLHNTDTRIDDALERPGPPLEIWQLDGPHP
ncbi:MAG: glycosyltransferase family 39 protein [Vicinamibacterales bacterium]